MANLTEKELSFLEDQLNAESLLVKKFRAVAENTTDPALKGKCEQISAKHKEHFDRLMTYLN